MGTKSAAALLTSVDSMFTTQEERDNAQRSYVTDLSTAEISDFPDHPFKVRIDESMTELADSVKERGILSPVLVRPMPDGGYQMVAGHRRKMAAELAGLPTVPCIVRELTDDEAVIIMVDSNLQRDQVLPSEKAFAYKMKLDAMKRQEQRTDLTSDPVGRKLGGKESAQIIGNDSGDSQTQVRRFIRLTNLVPELLDMVDNSVLKEKDKPQMALRPAVELSYLTENEQAGQAAQCWGPVPHFRWLVCALERSQRFPRQPPFRLKTGAPSFIICPIIWRQASFSSLDSTLVDPG